MLHITKRCLVFFTAAFLLLSFAYPATAEDIELKDITWETVGSDVEFHATFFNPDTFLFSGPVTVELNSQVFGAFVEDWGPICTFDIPPIPPESFFDVFCPVPMSELPPSAEKIFPGQALTVASIPGCPPDLFWAGNVDVFWTGPGGAGQVNAHLGTIQIGPGLGNSYIHVIMDCQDPAGVSWLFSGVCPGWSASLVSSDMFGMPGAPAPNPIPPGLFDGWICVSALASVSIGDICNFNLNLSCGTNPATIQMSAEACGEEPVALDIKPESCPNPLNVGRAGGVLPVALLGSAGFDVDDVDVGSLLLEGVAPIRWDVEDEATPFDGELCGCTEDGADGFADLTLKFDKNDIVAALGPAGDGDEVVLTLTGHLLDGTPIAASDCVRIISRGRHAPSAISLRHPKPNPFNPVTRIDYVLPERVHVTLAVYDVKGKLVKTLLTRVMPAGEHSVEWDAKGNPSGVYFVRLLAGDYRQDRKVVLLK